MTALNRLYPPATSLTEAFQISPLKKNILPNGVPAYFLKGKEKEALRIDLVFNAGVRNQMHSCIAVATASLLSEGTNRLSAREIFEAFDFYGAYFQVRCFADDAVLSLYCLRKNLSPCLDLVQQVVSGANFQEKEIENYKTISLARLSVNLEKPSFLVRRSFNQLLFGEESAYGTFSNSDDYKKISREMLVDHHRSFYLHGLKYVMVSGDCDDSMLKVLGGACSMGSKNKTTYSVTTFPSKKHKQHIEKKSAEQTVLRIGQPITNRTHPDYNSIALLNMVLGGFFGSRLMKIIREDLGLTYGIYSSLENYFDAGCFYIESDLQKDCIDRCLEEIYKQIDILQSDLIGDLELTTAKNYMLGSFQRSVDNVFSLSERYKNIIDYGLPEDHLHSFVEKVKSITAHKLREVANTHFNKESFYIVTVG
jgi:predicted Zn-dependent peptidase